MWCRTTCPVAPVEEDADGGAWRHRDKHEVPLPFSVDTRLWIPQNERGSWAQMMASVESRAFHLGHAAMHFRVRALSAGTMPPFPGPTIRGALGYTLKRVVCHVDHAL